MEASTPRRKQRLPSPEPAAEAVAPSLDSLPLEILETIVSCLPVRDVVRTSALSRAWRRLWESAPRLHLSWPGTEPLAAVDAVLARYACPVRDFCHWEIPDSEEAWAHTDEWIPVLAVKGVQSLTLRFRDDLDADLHTLHPAVFSCHELTHLSLDHCHLPAAHSCFAGFPNLTWLSLTNVSFPHGEKDLEALIRMSPLLETLELRDVWFQDPEFDEWVIHAPNLRSLTFVACDDYGLQIGELPSLQEANVSIEKFFSVDWDFVKLLTCFPQVRKLEFRMPLTEVNAVEGLSLSFQKLKSLTLHTDFCNVPSILSTFSLLRSAPNLEDLEIKIVANQTQNDEVDLDFFCALWTNSLFTNLKIVTMMKTPFWSNEMHFIEFILSKARLLCALFVYQDDDSDRSKPSQEAVIQLTNFRRVSPKAKVFLRGMDDYSSHGLALRTLVEP